MREKTRLLSGAENFIKGLAIGAVMLVPGMSGGTMAIICGIYDKLLLAVASVRKAPRKNLIFLGIVAAGGLIGMLLFSKLILYAFQTYNLSLTFFFIGAILGSVPMLWGRANVKSFSYRIIVFPLIGIALVVLMMILPENTFAISLINAVDYFLLFLIGILLAVALVLPGISFSYMLLIMGIYESALLAIQQLQLDYLSILGIGIIVGIVMISKLFHVLLTHWPQQTYLLIIGFVIASLKEVVPNMPNAGDIITCILALLIGFFLIFFLSKKYSR
jgi:putative membrane protein